jgi:hypothetical protein
MKAPDYDATMGRQAAEKEAAARRAPDTKVLHLERAPGQANAHAVLGDDRRCDPPRAMVRVGLLPCLSDHERDRPAHNAALTSLIPALSCRSCRPNAPFAELVQLSRTRSPTKCAKNTDGGYSKTDPVATSGTASSISLGFCPFPTDNADLFTE